MLAPRDTIGVSCKTYNFFKRELCMKLWLDAFFASEFPIPIVPVLQNGVLLCKIIERIFPEQLTQYYEGENLPFYQRKENIFYFIECCMQIGLSQAHLFSVADLFNEEINEVKILFSLEQLIKHLKNTRVPLIPALQTPKKLSPELFTKFYSQQTILFRRGAVEKQFNEMLVNRKKSTDQCNKSKATSNKMKLEIIKKISTSDCLKYHQFPTPTRDEMNFPRSTKTRFFWSLPASLPNFANYSSCLFFIISF